METTDTRQSLSDNLAVEPSAAAHARVLAEIDAVPESALTIINLDIPQSVSTTLGVLPEIRRLAPELLELKGFNAAALTKLEDYALALQHAHVIVLVASAPPEEIAELVAEATDAREVMLDDLQPLARRGLVPQGPVVDFERSLGHRGLAVDVAKLVRILREGWPAISGKTALTLEQLARFAEVGHQLLTAVGVREQGPALASTATRRRQQAFTLFVNAYDEVRRGVTYLRHHQGDADEIMPSLFVKGRRKSEAAPVAQGAAAVGSAAPVVAPAGTTGTGTTGTTGTTASGAVAVGMPGSSPFSGS